MTCRKKADATLTYADGRPPVTKARDVNAAVLDILGLDYNQFCQIAMIAQGQFTKLLNASTEERSRIFRKLFRTQRYAKLQDRLQEEASRLNQQRLAQNTQLDSLLAGLQVAPDDPDVDALAALNAPDRACRPAALLEGCWPASRPHRRPPPHPLPTPKPGWTKYNVSWVLPRQARQLAAQLWRGNRPRWTPPGPHWMPPKPRAPATPRRCRPAGCSCRTGDPGPHRPDRLRRAGRAVPSAAGRAGCRPAGRCQGKSEAPPSWPRWTQRCCC